MADPGWIIYACRTSFAVEVAEAIWRRGEEVALLVDNLEAGGDPPAAAGLPPRRSTPPSCDPPSCRRSSAS